MARKSKAGKIVRGYHLGGKVNDPNCAKKDGAKRKGKRNLKRAA